MIRYYALGNSITSGEGASSPEKAYPRLIVGMLRQRSLRDEGHIFAHPGWTSADLTDAVLDTDLLFRHATDISIFIGGNDLIYAALSMINRPNLIVFKKALSDYRKNLTVLIKALRRSSGARIICCTQYNPFPNSPLAERSIQQLNGITTAIAANLHAQIAPVHAWFAGKQALLISGYRTGKLEDAVMGNPPIHPNDRGHQTIASGMLPLIMGG